MKARISEVVFGQLEDGRTVKQYKLRNAAGAEATFVNLGAAWTGFTLSEDDINLVLGCETLDALINQRAYIGGTIGRYANRISHGQFNLNGKSIQVETNLPPHHIHGGNCGFANQLWESQIQLINDVTPTLTFRYFSEDGEAGFPGNVNVTVTITLTEQNTVRFDYMATTDQPTIINLTNHSYFNLNGHESGSLNHHEFKLDSNKFLESDSDAVPTGEILSSENTLFDFQNWKTVTEELASLSDPRIQRAEGYDHCYCYPDDKELRRLGSARSSQTGRELACYSNLPGMQFYTGNFLGGTPINSEKRYQRHGAFCFEPGFWPDSPNHPTFPNCVFDQDHDYSAIIEYKFK